MPRPPITIDTARVAKTAAKKELARLPGLMGIGLTRRGADYAIKVNLDHEVAPHSIPTDLMGVPLVVEVVGRIRKR